MNDSAVAIIGKSVQIRGEVNGSEDLVVDGHVEGTITLVESRLTIGPNAHVAANVSARDVILLGQLTFSVLAAYAFGRLEFPGRDALFWVYIATMMVPGTRRVERRGQYSPELSAIGTQGTSALL